MQEEGTIVESEQPAPIAEEPKSEIPENAAPEGDAAPEAPETPEQAEAKKQSKFQRRLERQKTARIAAETEARLLREELERVKAASAPKPVDTAPKREDFADDIAYLEARADHAAKKAANDTVKAAEAANAGKQQQDRQSAEQQRLAAEWEKRENAFKAQDPDYSETVEDFIAGEDYQRMARNVGAAILDSDVGPQLLKYLATHEDEAERIAGLSPARQVMEIGKLEDRMTKPVKKPSSAPAPINPVSAGRSGGKDISKMSVAEYKEYRKSSSAWIR